jgi:hypothetical protein
VYAGDPGIKIPKPKDPRGVARRFVIRIADAAGFGGVRIR